MIKEIEDHTPILGEIKRYQPWGIKMDYPGLGILFTQITPLQQQQLAKWLYPERFADLAPEARLREFHDRFLPIECRGVWMIPLERKQQ